MTVGKSGQMTREETSCVQNKSQESIVTISPMQSFLKKNALFSHAATCAAAEHSGDDFLHDFSWHF